MLGYYEDCVAGPLCLISGIRGLRPMAESCNVLINLEPLKLGDSIVRLDQHPPEFGIYNRE